MADDPYAQYGGSVASDPYAAYGGSVAPSQPASQQAPDKPGFFMRLGQSLGLPTSTDEAKAMADPVQAVKTAAMGGPAVPLLLNYAKTAFKGAKEGLSDAYQAGQDYAQGGVSGKDTSGRLGYDALHTILQATPIIGPSIDTAGQDVAQKNYSGAAGGLTGVVGQVAAPELAKRGSAAIKAIPSTERAGAVLGQVKAAAGDIPIDMSKPGSTALEIYTQSQRGGMLPKSVRDFINRATKPDSQPITYAEAKDFQSNISRLSADEYGRMNPNTRRLVGQLNADLKGSLQSAADTAGKGQQFADAMREYHNAMRLKGMSDAAIDYAIKAAITGGLGALGYKAFSIATEK